MNLILQVFYSVFSGLILGFALPNELLKFGCPWLALIALIPFYLAIKNSKNYKRAFLSGIVQTGTTHLFSSFWLANFKDFAALTLGASAFGTAMIGGVISFYLYFPFANSTFKNKLNKKSLLYKFFDSSTFQIFYFASLYTLYEWCKSCSFLGYPWATLSSTIYNWNIVMQIASFTGTYGISFLLVLVNALIAECCSDLLNYKNTTKNNWFDLRISAVTTAVLFGIVLLHGGYWELKKLTPQKTITSIIVQQNSNPWEEKSDYNNITNSQQLTEEQITLAKQEEKTPQLIVWSEGTLRMRYPESHNYYKKNPTGQPLIKFIQDNHIPLLTGGAFTRNARQRIYFNAALLFDENGNFRGAYGKNHLVPIAEAIPGMEFPKIKAFLAKAIGISSGWTPGDQYVLFDIFGTHYPKRKLPAVAHIDLETPYSAQKAEEKSNPKISIAAPICYDDAFPDIMRPLYLSGAELFMNLTDDSWSLKKSSEYQHFVVASYRSIELRTTMVRCCNAGYTVILDPKGKILKDLPLFEKAAFYYDVPVFERRMTIYARFGNWLPWLLFILFIGFCGYSYKIFKPSDFVKSERPAKTRKSKTKGKKKSE